MVTIRWKILVPNEGASLCGTCIWGMVPRVTARAKWRPSAAWLARTRLSPSRWASAPDTPTAAARIRRLDVASASFQQLRCAKPRRWDRSGDFGRDQGRL